MRKFTHLKAIVFLLTSVVWVGQSFAQWPETTFRDPRFSAEFSVKAYDRKSSDLNLPLVTDGDTFESLFDSDDATGLDTAAGAEVKFNFLSANGRELEFRTILADWSPTSTTITGTNLESPFFTVGQPAPTTVNYEYESDYFSVELMARRAVQPGITLMFGPRIVSTKDRVTFAGSLLADPGDGTPPVTVTETTTTEATNILLGLQTGLEFNLPITRDVYFNSYIRAGGYTNPTEVTQVSSTNISTVTTTDQQTKSTGSFLGEVGGRVYVDVIPQSMSTFVGYEANWIDGIALAPAQLLTTDADGIQTGNTPFFHALTFGVQFRR